MPANFTCDLLGTTTLLKHAWEHTVGSGRALHALRADWQQQLERCHSELGFRYVRFHGLLDDELGTLVIHQDEFLYSFFNADRIWDFLLSIGMRPFVELSFMPEALASGGEVVFQFRGNVTPPKDYDEWATLIRKLVGHWVERYGLSEVNKWFFEVWNEPNLRAFWSGTQEDYFKLYAHTAQAIKTVASSLQIGGPATAMNAWVEELLDYCEQNALPADFISTHIYPTDPLGFEGANTEQQLSNSPRHLMRDQAKLTRQRSRGRPVYYTEWNISSNPRDHYHDEPFAAAFATKILMETDEFVDGYSFWTFTDIFDENYFPSMPFHGGFGLLNLYGVPKPIYRAIQLLHHLGTEKLPVEGSHETVDAWVVRKDSSVSIVFTNHAQPRHEIGPQHVDVLLTNAPQPRTAHIERVDEDHSNPRARWQEMGEPDYLAPLQVEQLEAASRLVKEPLGWKYENRTVQLDIDLPAHAVAAITLEFGCEQREGSTI
ncbi:MAG: beta-xylosidase [Blastocatellia bacterium]